MAWNGSNMQQKNQLINWSTDLWRFRMVPTSTFYDTDPSQPQWKHFFHCRAASSRSRTWRITDLIRTLAKPSPNDQSEYRLQLPKQCEIFYKSLRKSYANQLQLKGSVWIMYVCIYVYINIYIIHIVGTIIIYIHICCILIHFAWLNSNNSPSWFHLPLLVMSWCRCSLTRSIGFQDQNSLDAGGTGRATRLP